MKKSLLVFAAIGVAAMVACGPSAEEKAKVEQARMDSIEQVRVQDSLSAAETAAKEEAEKAAVAMADSLKMVAMQDSMAKMKESMTKPKPKAKPHSEIKTETPKVGYKKPGAK